MILTSHQTSRTVRVHMRAILLTRGRGAFSLSPGARMSSALSSSGASTRIAGDSMRTCTIVSSIGLSVCQMRYAGDTLSVAVIFGVWRNEARAREAAGLVCAVDGVVAKYSVAAMARS